jgi:phospholipase C
VPGGAAGRVPSGQQARCGVGPRLPLLVISPFARRNFVDNTFTDQASIVQFIEDNWLGGERIGGGAADAMAGTLDHLFSFGGRRAGPLFLNPSTGEPERKR